MFVYSLYFSIFSRVSLYSTSSLFHLSFPSFVLLSSIFFSLTLFIHIFPRYTSSVILLPSLFESLFCSLLQNTQAYKITSHTATRIFSLSILSLLHFSFPPFFTPIFFIRFLFSKVSHLSFFFSISSLFHHLLIPFIFLFSNLITHFLSPDIPMFVFLLFRYGSILRSLLSLLQSFHYLPSSILYFSFFHPCLV